MSAAVSCGGSDGSTSACTSGSYETPCLARGSSNEPPISCHDFLQSPGPDVSSLTPAFRAVFPASSSDDPLTKRGPMRSQSQTTVALKSKPTIRRISVWGKDGSALKDKCDVDLSRGLGKKSARQSCLGLVPGVTTKLVGNLAGLAGLGAGYAMGKLDAAVWGSDMADSKSFSAACSAMLAANGIQPTVVCEHSHGRVGPMPTEDQARMELLRSAPIIVCNHVSYIDVTVLPVVLGMPKFVSKAEVSKWPIFGALGRDLDYVWVDRNSKESRGSTMDAISSHAESWKMGDRPLVLFPEGTTSSGNSLLEFRKGAFAPGKPVLPVVLKYTGVWDPSNPDYREALSSGDDESDHQKVGGKTVVRCSDTDWAAQFAGHSLHSCIVYVCEPYYPSAEEVADAQCYADNVRQVMLQTLKELHHVFTKRGDTCENADARIRAWRRRRSMKERTVELPETAATSSEATASSSSRTSRATKTRSSRFSTAVSSNGSIVNANHEEEPSAKGTRRSKSARPSSHS
eukprot:TRINITY_DN26857_c0_g3_i1.p1 TRINITY_DN26857_c0_g3~~TRINITY_DN26857_c0_g3_i1.p1  ORF type:complete len:515 (-),score=46.09 TRINITY_DN26857_c0_g3_i1:92-1636(-)